MIDISSISPVNKLFISLAIGIIIWGIFRLFIYSVNKAWKNTNVKKRKLNWKEKAMTLAQ